MSQNQTQQQLMNCHFQLRWQKFSCWCNHKSEKNLSETGYFQSYNELPASRESYNAKYVLFITSNSFLHVISRQLINGDRWLKEEEKW